MPLLGRLFLRLSSSFLGRRIIAFSLAQAFAPNPVPTDYLSQAQTIWSGASQTKSFAQDERTFNPSARALSALYGEIQVPTLILTGDTDSIVEPARNAYLLHETVPNSKLIVLKGAGHQIPQTRADEVLAAIDEAWEMVYGKSGVG
jgi:pimeloyl-ACP methyl ester carboxylesterase